MSALPPPERLVEHGATPERAEQIVRGLATIFALETGGEAWRRAGGELLRRTDPHAVHLAVFAACYVGHDPADGPPPAWLPEAAQVARTNIAHLGPTWPYVLKMSVERPEAFWPRILDSLRIRFDRAPDRMLEGSGEEGRWLPGARWNIAASVTEGREPTDIAIVHQRPGGPLQRIPRQELRERAEAVAGSLLASGLNPGDAVAIDMPMTADSVVVYLGIVLAGCAVVSIADSFAADEIRVRLDIAGAKAIFTQDVIERGGRQLPLYERVVDAGAPPAIVLPSSGELSVALRDGDVAWSAFLERGPGGPFAAHLAGPERVTNVLFSSGTTGAPKAIPWTQITPIKAAADGHVHHDLTPGDVVAWPTNLGWMMGPWLIYAALLNGGTIALFDGSPVSREFCCFVQDAEVTMLGVVPSLVRAWRDGGLLSGLDWEGLRCFSSTGEASSFDDMFWLMQQVGYRAPVIEYCGGTEIGGGYITGSLVQPQAPGTFSTPAIGCAFHLLGDDGRPATEGEVALRPPMFGSSNRLLNRDHHDVYFEGMPAGPSGEVLRRHGDRMRALGGGWYRAEGRVDDTMNLGGIKTSSAELERACSSVEGVLETAAIAVPPAGGGPDRLVVYAVVERGASLDEADLLPRMQAAIRARLNPLFKVHRVRVIDALPRTASGKVMRRVLRDRHQDPTDPPTSLN
jgi:acetyl-CoA synthetase